MSTETLTDEAAAVAPVAPSDLEEAPSPTPEPPKRRRKIVPFALGAALIVGGLFGFRSWSYGQTHVSTDDAQVTSSVVQVSPQVAGTVVKILVDDNQHVERGQLIAELDSDTFATAVEQAKANLALAEAQAREAAVNVNLAGSLGSAQIQQAQGEVEGTQGAISGSLAAVGGAEASVATARAQASGARSAAQGTVAAVRSAEAELKRAGDAVRQARALVTNAQAAARAAGANIRSQAATLANAQRNAERTSRLFAEGAIAGHVAEEAATALSVQQASLSAAQEQERSASALIAQRQAEVSTALAGVEAARARVAQARAEVGASQDRIAAADQAVRQAQAQALTARTAVQQAQARSHQATGTLAEANTAPVQVEIRRVGEQQALAKVAQAKAALDAAQLQLKRTKIYASVPGRVSKKTVTLGAQVQPGSPLMAIVPDESLWVVANFKETQLAKLRVGQPVDVEVDALPGVELHAHVDSLSAGTGATFALLPPDNATGNYTKVVQRVPVKIVFEPNQEHLRDLRVGMSVLAGVHTAAGRS